MIMQRNLNDVLTCRYHRAERAEHEKHYVEEQKVEVVQHVHSILAYFEVERPDQQSDYEVHR